ncbi:MAG: T9SS type A sorting domain-containing protein, partial [Bacteroidia bacterium]
HLKPYTVEIYTPLGQKVHATQPIYQEETLLHLPHLPAGMYLVKILSGQKTFTYRVAKE